MSKRARAQGWLFRLRPSGVGVLAGCVSNFSMRDTLTPITESPIWICGSHSTMMCVTRGRSLLLVTMKCKWQGGMGERPTASSNLSTGP